MEKANKHHLYLDSQSTTKMVDHLKHFHQIDSQASENILLPPRSSIANFMTESKQTVSMLLLEKKPFEKFQYLLIR